MIRVVIAAGGTGGHVYPALAVAAELQDRGVDVHFMGTATGLEARVVPAAGFPLATVAMQGLRRSGWRRWVALPWSLNRAVWGACQVLKRLRPHTVLAMGGYVTVPTGLAARLIGCPLILHEQNAVPGRAIRFLKGLASRILTGFPEAASQLDCRAEWVGIPVRRELLMNEALWQPRDSGHEGPLRILAFGGSQGAHFLNQHLPVCLGQTRHAVEIYHQAGEKELLKVREAYKDQGIVAETTAFIEDMARAYAKADLAICRSGAATVAELAVVGMPAVLVPFPFAVGAHQHRNAEALVKRGAAVCIPQETWQDKEVARRLDGDLGNRRQLAAMGEAARTFGQSEAARMVAQACEEGACHAA